MILRHIAFFVVLALGPALSSRGDDEASRASDLFEWPPAFEAMFGDPRIVRGGGLWSSQSARVMGAGRFDAFDGISRMDLPSKVVVPADADLGTASAAALARVFYRRVFDPVNLSQYERKLEMREHIELDEERFIRIAACRLNGRSTGSKVEDAWWTMRMGLPGTLDHSRHLVIVILEYDVEEGKKETHGHFCFGVRKKGGDAEGDRLYDFRAPWLVDRRHRVTEAVNLHGRLKLEGTSSNLYDWLYTQTEFRHCHVKMWFLPLYREQYVLLKHFEATREPHHGGNFRPFRKNCASLGMMYLDRLGPVTPGLTAPRPPSIDLPKVTSQRIIDQYEGEPFYKLPNVTDVRGREPTAKSVIRHAQPSRGTSRAFRKMAAASGIN